MDSMKHLRGFLFALVLCSLFVGPAFGATKTPKAPEGVKVASGQQFDIYVVRKESKPFVTAGSMLNIFEATIVVHHTPKHGRQLKRSRVEAIDADLLDPSMWQVGDFDGDGLDDYRSVAHLSKKGCRTWQTWIWLPDRERFTWAKMKIEYQTDASGKVVQSCR